VRVSPPSFLPVPSRPPSRYGAAFWLRHLRVDVEKSSRPGDRFRSSGSVEQIVLRDRFVSRRPHPARLLTPEPSLGPQPSPVPSPPPDPCPGRGGPPRLPAPGDCTRERHAELQELVDSACNSGQRRCLSSDSCELLAAKIDTTAACIAASQKIDVICFRGGDENHRRAVANEIMALTRCWSWVPGCRSAHQS